MNHRQVCESYYPYALFHHLLVKLIEVDTASSVYCTLFSLIIDINHGKDARRQGEIKGTYFYKYRLRNIKTLSTGGIKMKKVYSLMLVSLLLLGMVVPAAGSTYNKDALNYLTEKYDVPEDRIELYEGDGIMELEFTKESFWYARYMILADGEEVTDTTEKVDPLPDGAEPGIAPDKEPAILPLPLPADRGDDAVADYEKRTYGGIYIRVKTGEILEEEKMEGYFSAENKQAQQEWERLSKEAGKLDVSLYQKLQGLSSTEKVSVWIHPAPVVDTEELKTKFAALKEKYPDYISNEMELKDILYYHFGFDTPAILRDIPDDVDFGEGSDGMAGEDVITDGDAAVSYVAPDRAAELERAKEAEEAKTMPKDENFDEYNAFWEEFQQLRLEAISPSMEAIKDALGGMNAAYEDNGDSLVAELTATQVNEIAELAAVAVVNEDAVFTTMDLAEDGRDDMARISAPSGESLEMADTDQDEESFSYLTIALISLAILAAALVLYRHGTSSES